MLVLLVGMLLVALSGPAVAEGHSDAVSAASNPSASGFELSSPGNDDREKEAYHIPVVLNESVETYIEFFSSRGRSMFQQWLNNSARHLSVMKEILRSENLPEELV